MENSQRVGFVILFKFSNEIEINYENIDFADVTTTKGACGEGPASV